MRRRGVWRQAIEPREWYQEAHVDGSMRRVALIVLRGHLGHAWHGHCRPSSAAPAPPAPVGLSLCATCCARSLVPRTSSAVMPAMSTSAGGPRAQSSCECRDGRRAPRSSPASSPPSSHAYFVSSHLSKSRGTRTSPPGSSASHTGLPASRGRQASVSQCERPDAGCRVPGASARGPAFVAARQRGLVQRGLVAARPDTCMRRHMHAAIAQAPPD